MRADLKTIKRMVPAIRAVSDWLRSCDVPNAIIGGVAVCILGQARLTIDIDAVVLVEESRLPQVLKAASEFDIVPRIDDVLDFVNESRMLLLKHRPSGVEVDVALGGLVFEEELLQRAVEIKVADIPIRVPTVEDLIIMKCVANRAQDWIDIEGLLTTHSEIDVTRVLLWSQEFSTMIDAPEVHDKIEKVLRNVRSSSNKNKDKKQQIPKKKATQPRKAASKKLTSKKQTRKKPL